MRFLPAFGAFDSLEQACSWLYLAVDGVLSAAIGVLDPLRPEAEQTLDALHAAGIEKTVMLTGDSQNTARAIAQSLGVDEFRAEVLPEDKARYIRDEQAAGRTVVMIGDGINDTPALSLADVGIAVGSGATIAREVADVVIAAEDLRELVCLKRLSDALMRHKSRFAMTLVGIIGCMVLMVGGLGMRDTMAGFLDLLDHGVSHYATKVNLVENTDLETAKQLITELDGDWESYSGISMDGCTATLDIVHNDNKRFSVIDEDNREIDLRDDGVYLCLRLADRAKIGESIEFSPYGSEESYRVKVVGYNRSIMTESVTMTDRCADELGIQYSVSAIYTEKASSEIPPSELISGKQDKQQLMDSFSSFVSIMDGMVFILIIAAIVLGIVVLYNLGLMSYIERSRELATLKVLGFRSKKIGKLLITQNLWLTVIGVLLGLPAGLGTLYWMLTALAGEYEMKLMLGPLTYSVSILLTFGVSLLVGWMVARKNKKIDMVEALKVAE